MNVLVVCTGNICRSPVGEHLLRAAVPGLEVASAGTRGMTGHGMDPRSLRFLESRGIDGSAFTARRVSPRLLGAADLVLGLEQVHVDRCLAVAPQALRRTFRLAQVARWGREGTVPAGLPAEELLPALASARRASGAEAGDGPEDPIGFASDADYLRVMEQIEELVDGAAALLRA